MLLRCESVPFLFTDHHGAWAPEAARVELGIIRCGLVAQLSIWDRIIRFVRRLIRFLWHALVKSVDIYGMACMCIGLHRMHLVLIFIVSL